jgi:hypothetical protein
MGLATQMPDREGQQWRSESPGQAKFLFEDLTCRRSSGRLDMGSLVAVAAKLRPNLNMF